MLTLHGNQRLHAAAVQHSALAPQHHCCAALRCAVLCSAVLACSEWKVPFLPVKPWTMTCSIKPGEGCVRGVRSVQ